jgi:hypothetical protein
MDSRRHDAEAIDESGRQFRGLFSETYRHDLGRVFVGSTQAQTYRTYWCTIHRCTKDAVSLPNMRRPKSAITRNVEVANNTDISSRSRKDKCQWLGLPALDSGRAKGLLPRGAFIAFLAVAWIATIPLSAAAACNEYTFEFQAEPSFMASSVIRVQTRPRSARLTIDIGNKFKEALALDGAAAQVFCERLRQVLVIEQTDEPSMGLDGIQVSGKLKEANSPEVHFSFWSPDRARRPRDFAIVDAVFSLLESTTPSCLLNSYLEQLAIYFPFGIPVRRIAGPPLTLRVYGSLTINHIHDFDQIVDSLPSDVPLLIDMTNFNGMGTLLYESFRPLLSRTPAVKWKASPPAAHQLGEVGVATTDLDVVQGLYCAGQPMRFSRH